MGLLIAAFEDGLSIHGPLDQVGKIFVVIQNQWLYIFQSNFHTMLLPRRLPVLHTVPPGDAVCSKRILQFLFLETYHTFLVKSSWGSYQRLCSSGNLPLHDLEKQKRRRILNIAVLVPPSRRAQADRLSVYRSLACHFLDIKLLQIVGVFVFIIDRHGLSFDAHNG